MKKYILWGAIFLIVCIIGLWIIPRKLEKNKEQKELSESNQNGSSKTLEEVLDFQEDGFVGPGQSWTTKYIDFKFKFRPDGGHSYGLIYPGRTDTVFVANEGVTKLGHTPYGEYTVVCGRNEKSVYRMQLYKKRMVPAD